MSNGDNKVLISIDVQPDFITPAGRLTVPEDGENTSGLFAALEGHCVPVSLYRPGMTLLDMLAIAMSEPPMPELSHPSFAGPGRPAFSVIPRDAGETDFDRLWPPHCVKGTAKS